MNFNWEIKENLKRFCNGKLDGTAIGKQFVGIEALTDIFPYFLILLLFKFHLAKFKERILKNFGNFSNGMSKQLSFLTECPFERFRYFQISRD